MNLQDMRLEVREALKETNESTSFWTNAQLNKWLNEGAKVMASIAHPAETLYQFTCDYQTDSSSVFNNEYKLPADVDEVFGVYVYNGDQQELRPCNIAQAIRNANITGIPDHFYIRSLTGKKANTTSSGVTLEQLGLHKSGAKLLGLYPRPAAAHVITVCYYSVNHHMRVDGDVPIIPVEFRRGIIAYALALAKKSDDAYAEANIYQAEFVQFAEKCRDKQISRGQAVEFPTTHIRDDDAGEFFYHIGASY